VCASFLGDGVVVAADLSEFFVGGSDVQWCGEDWRMVVLDVNRTADNNDASPLVKTAVRHWGANCNWIATVAKAPSLSQDMLRYGSTLQVTGPAAVTASLTYNSPADTIVRSSGDWTTDGYEVGDTIEVTGTASNNGEFTVSAVVALTLTVSETLIQETVSSTVDCFFGFQDIINTDETNDTEYGYVTKNKAGVFEINGHLIIGDVSGSLNARFRSRGEQVLFTDQPCTSTHQQISLAEDSGTTTFEMGESLGSGDSRVGFNGSIISQDTTLFGNDSLVDLSATVTLVDVFGSTFVGIGRGVLFPDATGHHVTNTQFSDCGQIDLGRAESRGLIFSGFSPAIDGALLWNANIDIENSQFLANANSTSDSHAIEHPAQGTFTYTNLVFTGNDFDVHYTAAASSGVLTIENIGTSNASSSDILNPSGNSVVFETTVNLNITVKDVSGVAIVGAQVGIFRDDTGAQLMNEDTDGSGLATETFNFVSDTGVSVRVRLNSVGGTNYLPVNSPQIIIATGLDVTVTLDEDTISAN